MNLQQFLSRNNLSLSLVNDRGNAVYIGEATTVKPQKNGHHLRFYGTVKEGLLPYTRAVIHGDRKIFTVVDISPIKVYDGTYEFQLMLFAQ